MAATVLAANDLNHDEIITREEATKANKMLILAWDRYDLNKDGIVDASEIDSDQAAQGVADIENMRKQLSPAVGAVMEANDLNQDGLITKAEATKANRMLIRGWDDYDVNKDGVVDAHEVASASQR